MFRTDRVAGTADVSVPIYVVDSTAGTPETGWDFEETGIDLWYRRAGGAKVSITEATQTANGAHADGGVVHISDGRGRLDLPDAACAVGVPYVEYGGTITGMVVYGGVVQLQDPVAGLFQSFAIGSTGNTAGALHLDALGALGTDEIVGELIWVLDSSSAAKEWHPAWVTAYNETSDVATVVSARDGGNLPFTPEASVDRVARSGISRAQFVIPWNSAWDAEVQSEATDALNAYDPPTRAELTSDIGTVTAILGALNTAAATGAVTTTDTLVAYIKQLVTELQVVDGIADSILTDTAAIGAAGAGLTEAGGTGDHLTAINVFSVNGVEVDGAGTEGDPWGPAA